MSFAEAYDPFRALGSAWRLVASAALTLIVGGLLLVLTDPDFGDAGVTWQLDLGDLDRWRRHPEELAAPFFAGGAACCFGILLWLLNCLLRVGVAAAVERAARGGPEDFADLFRPRGRWLSMVGTTLLVAVIDALVFAPFAIASILLVWLGSEVRELQILAFAGIFACVAAGLVALAFVALGIALAPMAVAYEGKSPFDALQRSWELVRGQRLRLFFYYLVLVVLSVLGFLLCCIGVLFTTAWAKLAQYESYLRLVRPAGAGEGPPAAA